MPSFGAASLAALSKCHPKLQIIANAVIKEIDFRILDATRGRDAQERAFSTGKSKARFGQSAHNYVPAIAFDLFPAPYDWNNRPSFIAISKVILRIAKENKIPLRWGGDWDMKGDGNPEAALKIFRTTSLTHGAIGRRNLACSKADHAVLHGPQGIA